MTINIIDRFDFDGFVGPTGFDECVIGKDYHSGRPVYCIEKIISQLMQEEGECQHDMEKAIEHFDHNIAGTRSDQEPMWIWMGEDYE